jgi:hypothetical protein
MLEDPSWENGLVLALVFAGIALVAYGLVSWLRRRAGGAEPQAPAD